MPNELPCRWRLVTDIDDPVCEAGVDGGLRYCPGDCPTRRRFAELEEAMRTAITMCNNQGAHSGASFRQVSIVLSDALKKAGR